MKHNEKLLPFRYKESQPDGEAGCEAKKKAWNNSLEHFPFNFFT